MYCLCIFLNVNIFHGLLCEIDVSDEINISVF